MSRLLHRAPLALTSDGRVLLNARELVTGERLDDVVAAAAREGGRIFVGLEITAAELSVALGRLAHSHREVAAKLAGARFAHRTRRRSR